MAKASDIQRRKCLICLPIAGVLVLLIAVWKRHFLPFDGAKPLHDIDSGDEPFEVSAHNILFEIHHGTQLSLKLKKILKEPAQVKIVLDDPDIIDTVGSFTVGPDTGDTLTYIPINSKDVAGHCVMSFQSDSTELKGLFKVRIKIKVVHHKLFGYLSVLLGWCYLACWTITYYPQIYRNFARRSVVGFSFDYLALNLTGHLCYCVFNISFFYSNSIQEVYTKLHSKGELPVKIHDVLSSFHAVTMNTIYLIQILVYERGDQRLSLAMVTFVGGLWFTMIAGLFGAIVNTLAWLQYLYYLSYIKLSTTPIKYTPQLYLHCLRKNTEGWSIFSVILDFGGSSMCLLQILVDAVNNDDWDGAIGNPGKLGLSIIGVLYGSMFMIQHFILYPSPVRKRKLTDKSESSPPPQFSKKLQRLRASFFPVAKTGGIYDV